MGKVGVKHLQRAASTRVNDKMKSEGGNAVKGEDGRLMVSEMILKDPAAIPVLFHEQREAMMRLLVNDGYNIIELSKTMKMNPGTVKRHLDILMEHGLVFLSSTDTNEYGIKLKYYRAVARKFVFSFTWPPLMENL
jgi:DNA-binding transcriptional ArsR family regulator